MSKLKLMFIAVVIVFSVLFANLTFQLDLFLGTETRYTIEDDSSLINTNLTIADSPSHLMWFLQVSDLHLSIFHDKSRVTELEDFCLTTVDVIKPLVVLASGDLTDAKRKDNIGSAQYKEEWIFYSDVLNKGNIRNKTTWLDIRGNHDNSNIPGWKSDLNYYRNYSIQGINNPRSYMHIISHAGEKYAFIGLDASLEPGPSRPFNFFGLLTNDDIKHIKLFLKKIEDVNVNHIIWFGHYPSSCILSLESDSVRSLIGNVKSSRVYLCGHLHNLHGLAPEMYTLQKQGYLELELGDWKDNRMFRLAAIDHGLFSFVDNQHGTWPIALFTNPKHAMFVMPDREPLKRLIESSHIRLLAFSLSQIEVVQVKINNGDWMICNHIEGPLYTHPWDPKDFSSGLHTIYAKIRDIQGRERIIEQPFSIDGTKMSFKILAKIALMINATRIFQLMFGAMMVICILPLIILRYLHNKILIGKMKPWNFRSGSNIWFRRIWLLSTIDSLFYPLIIFEIYLCFGPWCVGEIMDGHVGAIFSWGIIVNGVYIPEAFTFMFGFTQMLMYQFPLTLLLAKYADDRFRLYWIGGNIRRSLFRSVLGHIPFIIILALQIFSAYIFWLAYGTMAFLLGPFRTWSIIQWTLVCRGTTVLNIYLWFKAVTLPKESMRNAANMLMSVKTHTKNYPLQETNDS